MVKLHTAAACFILAAASFARAADTPYDAMWRSYGVYLNPADPIAWPDKVRAIDKDEYHFWRGTRDLFYAWCIDHCADWQADRASYVVSQGDLHLGNVGAYAAAGGFGKVAYGLVDFDESARLPFQVDLLDTAITFELIARDVGIQLSAADRAALHAAIFDTYLTQLGHPTNNPALQAMLKPRTKTPYSVQIDQFTHDGRFRPTITKSGEVVDVLRPLDSARRAGLADALAMAVQNDARLAALLRPYDASDFQASILDAAERTRIDSSGSQGLSKILVLLHHPFRNHDGDGILYLKQQIPTAAERVGFVSLVSGPPGRRYVHDLDTLTHGQSLAASWCQLGGQSFWVTLKDPWSEEPGTKSIKTLDDLLTAAKMFAVVLADGHGDAAARIRPLLTATEREKITRRADEYLAVQADWFAQFQADRRTKDAIAHAEDRRALARP